MSPAPSRAMMQIDAAIAGARDPAHNACLRAERACLLVRHGRIDEARADISELIGKQERLGSPSLAVWILLAKGLLDHFSHLDPSARDRVLRAHALSSALQLRPLLALSAAWLAHMDYVHDDIAAMARHVAESLQEAAPDHHAARARASIVVAQAYHFAGRLDLAQPWYRRSREHADALGDQAMVSALMHNRAWLSGNQARLASIFDLGGADATAVRQALVSAESTGYFDQAAGTASLAALVRVLRAQLHVVQGEYAKGLALYAENYRAAIEQGFEHKRSLIYADMAWCHVHLGSAAQALAQARAAADALDGECDIDDRAVSNGRLAQVFKALGDTPASQRHGEQASVNLQSHRDQQAQIIQVLGVTLAKVNTS